MGSVLQTQAISIGIANEIALLNWKDHCGQYITTCKEGPLWKLILRINLLNNYLLNFSEVFEKLKSFRFVIIFSKCAGSGMVCRPWTWSHINPPKTNECPRRGINLYAKSCPLPKIKQVRVFSVLINMVQSIRKSSIYDDFALVIRVGQAPSLLGFFSSLAT